MPPVGFVVADCQTAPDGTKEPSQKWNKLSSGEFFATVGCTLEFGRLVASMIASLRGTIAYVHPPAKRGNFLVIEVGGVGYEVAVSAKHGSQIKTGQTVLLHTYLVVRENAQELFGFSQREELEMFSRLLEAKGLGPKTALHVMDLATPEQLRQAVATADPDYLVRTAKLTPRIAGIIVAGLRGKLEAAGSATTAGDDGVAEARDALAALGFSPAAVDAALRQAAPKGSTSGELIRAALKVLGRLPPRSL